MYRIHSALAALLLLACTVPPSTGGGPAGSAPAGGSSSAGGAWSTSENLPDRNHDIRGVITRVLEGSRIQVEEDPQDNTGSLKDIVEITASTSVHRRAGGALQPATFADLQSGQTVTAWYDGAVRESYPRQAKAVAVVIEEN